MIDIKPLKTLITDIIIINIKQIDICVKFKIK